jgi:hypothetical protein
MITIVLGSLTVLPRAQLGSSVLAVLRYPPFQYICPSSSFGLVFSCDQVEANAALSIWSKNNYFNSVLYEADSDCAVRSL